MSWNPDKQRLYMEIVEKSHKEERERARKLRYDANLDGHIYEGQYFLIEDALGEAYRAGAIDALSRCERIK